MERVNHVLERTQKLPLPPDEAFEFFADAFNLEAITPPWLHFRVLGERPIEMGQGALISYKLRLHGIPVRWSPRRKAGARPPAVPARRKPVPASARPGPVRSPGRGG